MLRNSCVSFQDEDISPGGLGLALSETGKQHMLRFVTLAAASPEGLFSSLRALRLHESWCSRHTLPAKPYPLLFLIKAPTLCRDLGEENDVVKTSCYG